MVLGARERLCEICDPLEGGAIEPGMDVRLKDRELVSVAVPRLQEEVVGGRQLMVARGLRGGRRGGVSEWVGRNGGGVCGKGRFDNVLEDFIYVHARKWRRRQDRGRMGRRDSACECSKSGFRGGKGQGFSHEEKGEWSRWAGCKVMSVGTGKLRGSYICRSAVCPFRSPWTDASLSGRRTVGW